jgi:hypothetical protein
MARRIVRKISPPPGSLRDNEWNFPLEQNNNSNNEFTPYA